MTALFILLAVVCACIAGLTGAAVALGQIAPDLLSAATLFMTGVLAGFSMWGAAASAYERAR